MSPSWAAATLTVAALLANGIWQSWFSQADGMTAFVLMFAAFLGWPLTTWLIALPIGWIVGHCEDRTVLRLAVLSGVVAATFAAYGMPRLWNLLVCAAVAVTVGLRVRRAAQDEADLESL